MAKHDAPSALAPSQPDSAARSVIPLDYHRPSPRSPVLVSPAVLQSLDLTLFVVSAAAFVLGSPALGCVLLSAGLEVLAFRVTRRGTRWIGTQAFIAFSMILLGIMGVAALASGVREGPSPMTVRYWYTENQTHRDTRSEVGRPLWISAGGVAWLGVLGGFVGARALVRRRARRNNPLPKQE